MKIFKTSGADHFDEISLNFDLEISRVDCS